MNKNFFHKTIPQRLSFIAIGAAILAAFILSVFSFMDLCTSACVEGHKYLLLGLKFEIIGMLFFGGLLATHLLTLRFWLFGVVTAIFLAIAFGSEVYFLYLQKYVIGSWCPICLGIAASVGIAACLYFFQFFISKNGTNNEGVIMHSLKISLPSMTLICAGFVAAMLSVSKTNTLEAAQLSLKDNIAFGTSSSPLEVYIFTDWYCPACEVVEPRLEKLSPMLQKQAKVYFIDANIHDESMNFTPYNLSFMIHNKQNYFELRRALQKIAALTKTPTDAQVQEAIKPYKQELKDLSYMDIALGSKMFSKLKEQLGVSATPMIIIVNLETKKGKRLSGKSEITEANVMSAIDSLK